MLASSLVTSGKVCQVSAEGCGSLQAITIMLTAVV